ncbi:hypothetical protein N7474_005579 [Penicillium riverlandense]|uniref:uncharacterized protein n=1 Tax=Penicillium riverlandense TaxID=1903569 RepID=UPI002546A343|nr:uncharacterized protein N7474_005579 [Penicillium riverlandense]KAJ5819988.1 hypothetical protein N7474_005579 [Penicillium riverlandense]
MRFFNVPIFVALLGLTEAAPKPKSRQTEHHTSTKVSYQTDLALEPYHGHVPTVTVTRTQTLAPIIIIYTSYPTVTKTPAVVTDTKTKCVKSTTSVTATANTDTVCVTSTEFDTTTWTYTPPTVTDTVYTETTITTTSTSSIPTAYGFVPVDFRYPKSVRCIHEVFIEVIIIEIIIGPPVTKWLPAHTTLATKTDTFSVTSTIVPPDVSATVTDTITSTICVGTTLPAETDTVTSTNTATASVVSSAYDACATNNIAISPFSSDYGSFAGQGVVQIFGTALTAVQGNSPYDCCVSCIQDGNCAVASYDYDTCYHVGVNSCDPSENQFTVIISALGSYDYSLSNGACGYVVGEEIYLRRVS